LHWLLAHWFGTAHEPCVLFVAVSSATQAPFDAPSMHAAHPGSALAALTRARKGAQT
jgi:hypothetical protein